MNECNELLEYMYKDATMACYTLEKLLEDLKGKDNKITNSIEDILNQYKVYIKTFSKALKKEKIEVKTNSFLSKMMASMGIKREVIMDNSDASIADMLIKGISMGSLDVEKKITQYQEQVDKKDINLARDFLKFQTKAIDELKKYL